MLHFKYTHKEWDNVNVEGYKRRLINQLYSYFCKWKEANDVKEKGVKYCSTLQHCPYYPLLFSLCD